MFFYIIFFRKIASARSKVPVFSCLFVMYPFGYPQSKCQCRDFGIFAFFHGFCYTFYRERGQNMKADGKKNLSSRDRLIATLETQIQKQEEIIKT